MSDAGSGSRILLRIHSFRRPLHGALTAAAGSSTIPRESFCLLRQRSARERIAHRTGNFHAYPWMIHRLTYRRHNHQNLHVRGYKEQGSINTPFELAILNQIDRFSIAIDAIDRVPKLEVAGAHAKDKFKDEQIACRNYAYENGIDKRGKTANWPRPGGLR